MLPPSLDVLKAITPARRKATRWALKGMRGLSGRLRYAQLSAKQASGSSPAGQRSFSMISTREGRPKKDCLSRFRCRNPLHPARLVTQRPTGRGLSHTSTYAREGRPIQRGILYDLHALEKRHKKACFSEARLTKSHHPCETVNPKPGSPTRARRRTRRIVPPSPGSESLCHPRHAVTQARQASLSQNSSGNRGRTPYPLLQALQPFT